MGWIFGAILGPAGMVGGPMGLYYGLQLLGCLDAYAEQYGQLCWL